MNDALKNMITRLDSERSRRVLSALGLLVITLLALWYRRPDQLSHPYIWVEDGAMNVHEFNDHGWGVLFIPYGSYIGYFSLPSRFIFALASTLSFRWYPEISYWLTVLFTYAVVLAIAKCPTQLRNRFLCAAFVLLIPIRSEPYAVSLYAGWIGSLLAVLPLLWREDSNGTKDTWLRAGLLVVGGLSSPFVVPLVAIYALRALIVKSRPALTDLAVCVLVMAIQEAALIHFASTPSLANLFGASPHKLVELFFGYFLLSSSDNTFSWFSYLLGVALLLFTGGVAIAYRKQMGLVNLLLWSCLGASIALSVIRLGTAIHPALGGQRYFFFPFIFLSWLVIQAMALPKEAIRLAAMAILVIAVRNALGIAQLKHDEISWRDEIQKCTQVDLYRIPFHFTGKAAEVGYAIYTGAECRGLISRSLFDNQPATTPEKQAPEKK